MFRYREYLAACPIVAAPLAEYTDEPFRGIIRGFFDGLVFTEMVSLKAMSFRDPKTHAMIKNVPNEKPPVGIQVFCADAETVKKTIEHIVARTPAVIDINFACPVRKVMRAGCGAAIMDDHERGLEIARAVIAAFPGDVSVKLRLGVREETIGDFVARLADAGVAAVTLHGRTAKQMYSGIADRRRTLEIASSAPIPVIASGDIFATADVREVLDGGAAGALIARGMIGRPWFPAEAAAFVAGREAPPAPKIAETAIAHLRAVRAYRGERAVPAFRRHLAAYARGFPRAAETRNRLVTAKTFDEVEEILRSIAS